MKKEALSIKTLLNFSAVTVGSRHIRKYHQTILFLFFPGNNHLKSVHISLSLFITSLLPWNVLFSHVHSSYTFQSEIGAGTTYPALPT